MTFAVCFKCGHLKFGAFLPCDDCSALPQNEEEVALSLAMTDHYFDLETLKQIGTSIAHGKPPHLDEQTHAQMLELIRGPEAMPRKPSPRSRLPRLDGADLQDDVSPAKPWWKFW